MIKKIRKHKVYDTYQNGSYTAQIRLQGKWVEELGFKPGDELKIECYRGRLIIRKSETDIRSTN